MAELVIALILVGDVQPQWELTEYSQKVQYLVNLQDIQLSEFEAKWYAVVLQCLTVHILVLVSRFMVHHTLEVETKVMDASELRRVQQDG